MRDFLTLGSTPTAEPCAQVGSADYWEHSGLECRAFIAQLRRQFGTEPDLAWLGIRTFPHDFGTYREVVIYYDNEDGEAIDFAYKLEAELPEFWDEEAKSVLWILPVNGIPEDGTDPSHDGEVECNQKS